MKGAKTVLLVGASPRQGGNSDLLLQEAARGLVEKGAAADMVQLRDLVVNPCNGCEACRKAKKCVAFEDGMTPLYPRLEDSRGLILASPCHHYNITAWMKAFIDRLYCYYDFTGSRPRRYTSRLAGQDRVAVVMAVSEQPDQDDMGFTLEAMARPLEVLGFEVMARLPVYGLFDRGAVAGERAHLEKAAQAGRDLAESVFRNSAG